MHITDISIPTRYRSNYDKIEELACSIAQHGLFNPIILTQNMELNQGGRRLSALRLIYEVAEGNSEELGVGEETKDIILATNNKALLEGRLKKDLHYRIVEMENRHVELLCELEENLQRVDITWQDKAKLVAAIHEQQQAICGESTKAGGGWSMSDTAKKLGMAPSSVCNEIRIAQALKEEDSDIEGSKDRATALKKILEKAEAKVNAELRRRDLEKLVAFDASSHLYNLDAIECVQKLSLGDFNHVITDPPYAIEFDRMTAGKAESAKYLEMTKKDYIPYMTKLSEELYARMSSGFFVCFCAHVYFHELADAMRNAGFSISSVPLLWFKIGDPGKNHHPDKQLTSHSEYAVVSWKNIPQLNVQGKGNVFDYRSHIDIKDRFHITQKPVELLEEIVNTFTHPGETVLDCFMGSGSTIKACLKLKRGFIGNDKSEYFDETRYSIMKYKEEL